MQQKFEQAQALVQEFKGDRYINGFDLLTKVGEQAAILGKRAALVHSTFRGTEPHIQTILESLRSAGVEVAGTIKGAAPNAPLEDLARITKALTDLNPDVIVSFGGGSTIDCTKAAEVLRTLGGTINDYFGTGMVTAALKQKGTKLTPHLAVQTASSSAAHLTKYSNITDLAAGQKKLIVDEAIVPDRAVFDYGVSSGAPAALTADGALDGVSHCLEVLYGAVGKPHYTKMEAVAGAGMQLAFDYLPAALKDPADRQARHALGLASDLGGYSIMLGGTNGAHLTSFSLIDILSHGRACAMLNPYYTVFFAPAVKDPLKILARALKVNESSDGAAVAEGFIDFEKRMGLPTRLEDVPGFTPAHIQRALTAAKDPQLKMKLENMPVPLTPDMVDEYMGSVLEAAATGDLSVIRTVSPAATGARS